MSNRILRNVKSFFPHIKWKKIANMPNISDESISPSFTSIYIENKGSPVNKLPSYVKKYIRI